jgi:hypothetical protein
MATRIRLLVAVPDAGRSGDIVEMPRGEAAAWVDAGRAEFVDAPEPYEAAIVDEPENTARRTRRPRGRT